MFGQHTRLAGYEDTNDAERLWLMIRIAGKLSQEGNSGQFRQIFVELSVSYGEKMLFKRVKGKCQILGVWYESSGVGQVWCYQVV